ncbi:hypothetical protein VTO42DRAFT_3725 [Malbranchea cinnamomea]
MSLCITTASLIGEVLGFFCKTRERLGDKGAEESHGVSLILLFQSDTRPCWRLLCFGIPDSLPRRSVKWQSTLPVLRRMHSQPDHDYNLSYFSKSIDRLWGKSKVCHFEKLLGHCEGRSSWSLSIRHSALQSASPSKQCTIPTTRGAGGWMIPRLGGLTSWGCFSRCIWSRTRLEYNRKGALEHQASLQ